MPVKFLSTIKVFLMRIVENAAQGVHRYLEKCLRRYNNAWLVLPELIVLVRLSRFISRWQGIVHLQAK